MRRTYYQFPEGTPENTLLGNGCGVFLISGEEIFPGSIPDDKRHLVSHIGRVIPCSITHAKELLKAYGGAAWTEHFERDGGLFEVSEVKLGKNNSRFKYNRHL